jgi:hypothetical protein
MELHHGRNYLRRMIGEHVENGNTEQTQNNTPNAKLEDIMIEGLHKRYRKKVKNGRS